MEDEEGEDEEGVLSSNSGPGRYAAWYDKNGRLHRLNGPALTFSDGYTEWYKHGLLHRDDGPAVVYPIYEDNTELPDVRNEWFKNDMPYEPSAHEIMVWKMKWKEENK